MFSSAVVAVTPSNMFSSAVSRVAPSNIFISAAVDVTPVKSVGAIAMLAVPSKFTPAICLAVSKAVAVAALPVVSWLPAEFTPGRVISALPSNDTPPMLRAVAKAVAVAALPVAEPALPETLPVTLPVKFPVTSPVTSPVTFPVTLPVRLPVTSPVTSPVTFPSKAATTVPAVPEKTSLLFVASGMNVNLPVLSSKPKNPTLAAEPLWYLNSIPRSLLSSEEGAESPPIVKIGSSTVTVVLFTVVVVPSTVRFPEIVTLPEPSLNIALSAGYVINTSLSPAEKFVALPLLDDERTVVRVRVEPLEANVPSPTSHSSVPVAACTIA